MAGQLGAAYAIPIIYVPLLMITHFVAFYWLCVLGPRPIRYSPPLQPRTADAGCSLR